MKKKLLFSITTITLLFLSNVSFSQTLELGTLSSFEAYTGAGAATNSGIFTGNVGTNDGIISGLFSSLPSFSGTIQNNNALTVQARIDLLRVYIHLSDIFVTHPGTHAPAFGSGETITPGVYSIGGAGSIAGTLTLDGGGNPNAAFIMKFEGAFTAGAGSKIVLTNGTRACNVFWIAEGAISIGANSIIKGTLFSHPGAVSLGTDCNIEGRLLASEGAITVGAGSVAIAPVGPITIPIHCLGNCSSAPAVNVLRSVAKFALFSSIGAVANAATSGIVGDIGAHAGAISGFGTSTQVGSVYNANPITTQAKIDLDYAYSQLILLPITVPGHTAAFGSGETLHAGVYYIGGAGSLAGTLTLDGQNNPDAIFVFRFNGAFSVAAQSKVILTNGTRRCNVFWISEGATDLGTFTYMKGTLLAHGGACSAGANSNLEGRMLSTAGAIGFSTGVIYNDTLCFGEDDKPISGGDQTVCSDETTTQILTATATSNSTGGTIIWYDAATGGALVSNPTQVGIGSKTYYAESFNGTYSSATRTAVSLTINNCSVAEISSIAITKLGTVQDIAPLGLTNPGDTVTYSFVVKNTGNTNLTNIDVTDPMVGLTITGSPIASLAVGASSSVITGTYTITQTDIDTGKVTNSATASAKDPKGNKVTDVSGTSIDDDEATVTTLTQSPSVALVKTASVSGTGIIGDVITYTFAVTNTGNTTLTNVVITDPMIGLTISGSPIASLTVGASSSIIKGTHTITQADIDAGKVTNSATASAKDPKGNNITDVSGTSIDDNDPTVTTFTQTPAVALVKTANLSGSGKLGDKITYIFTVTNTGNTTLTNIVVTDPMVGLTIIGIPIASLAPGKIAIAIAIYTITKENIDAGKVTNSATVTAKDPKGNDVSDVSGTTIDDNDPTVTPTPTQIAPVADFTPTIDIDSVVFLTTAPTKDFVVNISEIGGAPSFGQLVVKIQKLSAFTITYGASTSTSSVSGGVTVNNNNWTITEDSSFITMTLKAGVIIGKSTSSAIGFSITLKSDVPTQTAQPITTTIINGSGSDGIAINNTTNTIVKAQ